MPLEPGTLSGAGKANRQNYDPLGWTRRGCRDHRRAGWGLRRGNSSLRLGEFGDWFARLGGNVGPGTFYHRRAESLGYSLLAPAAPTAATAAAASGSAAPRIAGFRRSGASFAGFAGDRFRNACGHFAVGFNLIRRRRFVTQRLVGGASRRLLRIEIGWLQGSGCGLASLLRSFLLTAL